MDELNIKKGTRGNSNVVYSEFELGPNHQNFPTTISHSYSSIVNNLEEDNDNHVEYEGRIMDQSNDSSSSQDSYNENVFQHGDMSSKMVTGVINIPSNTERNKGTLFCSTVKVARLVSALPSLGTCHIPDHSS